MGADDFIDLTANCDSDPESEENDLHTSCPSEPECETSTSQMKDAIPNRDNTETSERNGVSEEDKPIETMGLEVDLMQTQHVLQESVQLVESVTMMEKVNKVEVGQKKDGCTVTLTKCTDNNLLVDTSPISGVKRARVELVDHQPSVRVVYSFLTRESKKRLMELMQQWSEWHAQCQSPSKESSIEAMEYGEETYFPALHVGPDKSSTVSFWLDSQSSKDDIEYKLNNGSVPLYDRGCTLGSSLPDGSTISERIGTHEASRCFNCSSYNHSLKDCAKPRDNVAISNARNQHNSKRNQTSGSRTTHRYYEKASGKFDDLRAGVLGLETRESLGIGEFDPPPWLHRMREMGYPPGYLDAVEDEDQPSGIMIFGNEETTEDEERVLPEKGNPEAPQNKMTVEFPGINAPIPENAVQRLWAAAPSGFPGSDSSNKRPHLRLIRPSEPQRAPYHPGPPGVEYASAPSMPGYSPRYGSPYDHNAIPRSPNLARSLSDRGWRSPLPYESSPGHSPHSPYPYSSLARQSPQYRSPVAAPEHWSHENPYNMSPDILQQQSRDRHDHRHHHRR